MNDKKILWLWDHSKNRFFDKEVTSLKPGAVLFNAGMALSVGDSNRLIKGNSISFRQWHDPWAKVNDQNFQLPIGEPFFLKVGNGLYRLPQDPNASGIKFICLPGIRFVMIPEFLESEGRLQDINILSEIWGE